MLPTIAAQRSAPSNGSLRFTELVVSTQTGHPNFPEAAAQIQEPSASFAARKQAFVISHTRAQEVGRERQLSG